MNRKTVCTLAIWGIFLPTLVCAQATDAPPPSGVRSRPATPRRDPTRADGELRLLLEQPQAESPTGPPRAPWPTIAVRARILASGRPATALLSVGEEFHKVSPGMTMGLDGERTLTVLTITREGVEVELQPGSRQVHLP
ncbi:MAG: hypothetical protein U0939_12595 [Pirellulales bacterium]